MPVQKILGALLLGLWHDTRLELFCAWRNRQGARLSFLCDCLVPFADHGRVLADLARFAAQKKRFRKVSMPVFFLWWLKHTALIIAFTCSLFMLGRLGGFFEPLQFPVKILMMLLIIEMTPLGAVAGWLLAKIFLLLVFLWRRLFKTSTPAPLPRNENRTTHPQS